ncbi:MAG: low molecular weight phosphatase family protein [Candidatus Nanosalina sp.]
MRILYICTGNSHRSPVAEALTRKYHKDLEVESAGTDAAGHIADIARKELEEEGAEEFLKTGPDQLSERAVKEADKVVCMMPRHERFLERNFDVEDKDLEVWRVEDPINPGVEEEEAFNEIKRRVKNLE